MKFKKKGLPKVAAARDMKLAQAGGHTIVGRVKDIIEPLCAAEGLELVHVEYQREPGGRTLRIYIDKPGGVALDDCVSMNRQLSDVLDIYLENEQAYNLEISSPGLNRPLGKLQDYERFKGQRVKLKISETIQGKKIFQGILKGIVEGMVTLLVDDKVISVPFQKITRARLIN